MKRHKNVAILGSTGSVGRNALRVIASLDKRFKVVGLSSLSNVDMLAEQIREFRPSMVTVVEPSKAQQLKANMRSNRMQLFSTVEGLEILASSDEVDIVVIALSGACALQPLLAAIRAKKHICLANKESLVMAGELLMDEARRNNACLIPVDSEHSAIFQCIDSHDKETIGRIYLTGSGGPLHKVAKSRFSSVGLKQVLNHPRWKMGRKITVDSATLMNKGLEMIEAMHLFNTPIDKIKLLIHPEAIIHSMVEFIDGAIIAQLGVTDMRLPIQYALTYPNRAPGDLPRVDFSKIKALNFRQPDMRKYPCLSLAMVAARLSRTYPAVLSAADEVAVKAFLDNRIPFVKIPAVVEKVLLRHRAPTSRCGLDDILNADRWAREEAQRLC